MQQLLPPLVFSDPKTSTLANNKWHEVKVKVDGGPYSLSYRRGYFAVTSLNSRTPSSNDQQPCTCSATGGKDKRSSPADLHSSPIIFTASIVPAGNPPPTPGAEFYALNDNAPAKKGRNTYSIFYSLPPDVLATHTSTAARMLPSRSPSSASLRS